MKDTAIKDEKGMQAFAEQLAKEVAPGTVIGLIGDLGAGKTTFARYFTKALGVRRDAKSPTFILLQEFTTGPTAAKRGLLRVWHADAYRIENERDLWAAGLADAVADASAVTLVEWADKLPSLARLPAYLELTIFIEKGSERRIVRT